MILVTKGQRLLIHSHVWSILIMTQNLGIIKRVYVQHLDGNLKILKMVLRNVQQQFGEQKVVYLKEIQKMDYIKANIKDLATYRDVIVMALRTFKQ